MTNNTPTIAELEAALDYLAHEIKAQFRTHVEFNHASLLMGAVGDMHYLARIGLRALKAKEAGAKMVGAEPDGQMSWDGVSAMLRIPDQNHLRDKAEQSFKAMHTAAECLLEDER